MAFRFTFKSVSDAEAYAVKKLAESKKSNGCLVGYTDINVIQYGKNKGRYEINWLIDASKLLPEKV
jgi:hypothetical protein